jgi:hypothetical protein
VNTHSGVSDVIPYDSPEHVAEVIHDVYATMMSGKKPGSTEYIVAIARNFTAAPSSQVSAIEAAIRHVFGEQQLDMLSVYDAQHIDNPTLTVTNVSVGVKVSIAAIDT